MMCVALELLLLAHRQSPITHIIIIITFRLPSFVSEWTHKLFEAMWQCGQGGLGEKQARASIGAPTGDHTNAHPTLWASNGPLTSMTVSCPLQAVSLRGGRQ